MTTKVHLVKAMVFPVVMYGCESWTIKKAEHWRTDAFELWCWRRLLRVTARRSNQCILKEISPEYPLEGLMLKLKLQYFGHLDGKNWVIWKDPDAGKDWRQEEKETTEDEMVGWHHWLDGHEFEQSLGVGDGQGSLVCCSQWGHKESDTTKWLNWIELNLEEGMVTHCSILAWKIPWTDELCRLQSIGLQRVGHNWSELVFTHAVYLQPYLKYSKISFINF